jgi:beta-lactamase regulating signal transducer with metallopeptidase domain
MKLLAQLLSPVTMRLLALTLLHFLWQGTALAAAAYVGISFLRSASARYALCVGVLVFMLAAPATTFLILNSQPLALHSTSTSAVNPTLPSERSGHAVEAPNPSPTPSQTAPDYFFLLVELWFAGVVLFSLRSAGGFFMVERLRRKESMPVSRELLDLCQALQQKMGINRIVRYCESLQLCTPAVVGWIRPVVLLPVTALSGLNNVQLQAVIAHELAHIQRLDAFVNLFQLAVESLFFYHPAVWWLGKRIREERENCCDDVAVAICGSPVPYAHALARMAESRVAPQLAMAANRGPLAARVARLLGIDKSSGTRRGANLSVGVFCLSAALLAGSALIATAHTVRAQSPSGPEIPVAPSPAQLASRPVAAPRAVISPGAVTAAVTVHFPSPSTPPASAAASVPTPAPAAAPIPAVTSTPALAPSPMPRAAANRAPAAQAAPQPTAQSYIDGLKSAGLSDLTVDQLIALKVQGVTPEYVKQMHDVGLHLDADELVGLKVQGISPDYVREMRIATGQTLDADSLIGLKVQGITPDYIKQLHDLGIKTEAEEVIGMKVQGITPEYVRDMRTATGQSLDADSLIGLKVQGVTPEYIKQLHDLGIKTDADEIVGMKVQGITPDYVKAINALGFHPSAEELIGMKVQGADAAYLKELQSAGFKFDIDEAIGAKVQGVTPEFIQKVHSHGFKDLSLEQLIALKRSGVLEAAK